MSILPKIRLGAAIVLLCAIFLPLSQCSQSDVRTPQALAHSHHFFPRSDDDFQYQYAIKYLLAAAMNPRDDGALGVVTFIAFLWPLGFAIWSRKSQLPRFWWIFCGGELLLCAGTAYILSGLTQGGRWLYGAYVGEIAISIYAVTTLIAIVDRIRQRRSAGHQGPSHIS